MPEESREYNQEAGVDTRNARAVLRSAGYLVTDDGVERMRRRVEALDSRRAKRIEAGEE